MGVVYRKADIDAAIQKFKTERVKKRFEEVGKTSVEVAKQNGNYRNRTGNLRRSNFHEATEERLIIGNKADYASDVEMRGYDVISSAVVFAKNELTK